MGFTYAPSKLDLYAEHRDEYVAPREPTLVDVGPARYLAIIGKGKPGGDEFAEAVGALHNIFFTIKMASKAAGSDYAVSKLEGLRWKDGPSVRWAGSSSSGRRSSSRTSTCSPRSRSRERDASEAVSRVTIEVLDEGKCVQVLHVGPYTAEEPTLAKMGKLVADRGLSFRGVIMRSRFRIRGA